MERYAETKQKLIFYKINKTLYYECFILCAGEEI